MNNIENISKKDLDFIILEWFKSMKYNYLSLNDLLYYYLLNLKIYIKNNNTLSYLDLKIKWFEKIYYNSD